MHKAGLDAEVAELTALEAGLAANISAKDIGIPRHLQRASIRLAFRGQASFPVLLTGRQNSEVYVLASLQGQDFPGFVRGRDFEAQAFDDLANASHLNSVAGREPTRAVP